MGGDLSLTPPVANLTAGYPGSQRGAGRALEAPFRPVILPQYPLGLVLSPYLILFWLEETRTTHCMVDLVLTVRPVLFVLAVIIASIHRIGACSAVDCMDCLSV